MTRQQVLDQYFMDARHKLIEVAAFHTKLKASGYNPAKDLNDRLIAAMTAKQEGN